MVRVSKPVALLRLVSAAVLSLPLLAQAAGLGRLSVQSFLGQPLLAEIEVVSVQPGEESSLEARLASGNAFAQAGIEFNPALTGIQFTLDKRDGRSIIRVSTRQPVNEPFVDLLVELRWATGLFVREYTVLLDPPGYLGPKPPPMAVAPAAAPTTSTITAPAAPAAPSPPAAAPAAPAAAESKPMAPRAEQAPVAEPVAPAMARPDTAREAKAAPAAEKETPAAQAAQTHEVRKGDTLGEIALQYRPQGVTFNQMLIALQRANEDAFINNNINLVRAGRILNIPDADAAAAVEPQDANRLVLAQHADFAEYRSRLGIVVAATPVAPQAAQRSAAGQITPKTEEPKPAPSTDQLKLSKADPKKPGAAKAAREDDLAARQRALQEAQSRVAELEKSVSDLQKLLEIRNQQLAQMQQKAAAKPVPAPAAKAPEPPKPAPAPQAATAPEAKPAAPSPAPLAPEALKPVAETPKPVPPAAPVAAKPKPRPMAPPPPEPSLLDEILDNPIGLPLLGAVVLLLVGYGVFAWQRKKKSVSKFQDSVLGRGSIEPVVGMDAAPAAAAPASVAPSSASQAPVGGMGTDDVDPIAEADVYMAYGRDAQAEEILKEALQKDPNRIPVMAKLLEIYANRRDAQSFEPIALKLKGVTNGAGPDWEKAMALGRNVDPGNGLYGGGGAAAPVAAVARAAPAAVAAPAVDFDIGGGSQPAAEPTPSLDLDLGSASAAPEQTDFAPSGTLVLDAQETKAASNGLDFDLGGGEEKPADTGGGLNFELPGAAPAAPEAAPAPSASGAGGGLDFDLNLGGSDQTQESASAAPMDLSTISLDLGTPGEPGAAGGEAQADPKWQEVATKLDLAKAYEEMGDKDGARELLNEVLREGDAAQQGQANQLLAKLG
ncbi:MAG: pilus assembly protein FimV [Betaproteobacteria bacterium]|nr:pilus assembly protein FimV [Betaproteobacteria bacterium]